MGSDIKIGAYQVLNEIGRGAQAVVYRARHTRLDQVVALKLFTPTGSDAILARERFFREARAMSQVNHPNITRIYDVGEHGEHCFLAMELLNGPDLSQVLRQQGRIALPQAKNWLKQIAAGLESIHSLGIIHRDVKPANIIISQNTAKIADFGMVHNEQDKSLTQTGEVLGTPAYMSPEQFTLPGKDLDNRSDIFSLGVIAYEMLTGANPFIAPTVQQTAKNIIQGKAPKLSQVRPDVPSEIADVIQRSLATRRNDRIQTARRFSVLLDGSVQVNYKIESDSELPITDVAAHAEKPSSHNKIAIILTLVLALILTPTAFFLNSTNNANIEKLRSQSSELEGLVKQEQDHILQIDEKQQAIVRKTQAFQRSSQTILFLQRVRHSIAIVEGYLDQLEANSRKRGLYASQRTLIQLSLPIATDLISTLEKANAGTTGINLDSEPLAKINRSVCALSIRLIQYCYTPLLSEPGLTKERTAFINTCVQFSDKLGADYLSDRSQFELFEFALDLQRAPTKFARRHQSQLPKMFQGDHVTAAFNSLSGNDATALNARSALTNYIDVLRRQKQISITDYLLCYRLYLAARKAKRERGDVAELPIQPGENYKSQFFRMCIEQLYARLFTSSEAARKTTMARATTMTSLYPEAPGSCFFTIEAANDQLVYDGIIFAPERALAVTVAVDNIVHRFNVSKDFTRLMSEHNAPAIMHVLSGLYLSDQMALGMRYCEKIEQGLAKELPVAENRWVKAMDYLLIKRRRRLESFDISVSSIEDYAPRFIEAPKDRPFYFEFKYMGQLHEWSYDRVTDEKILQTINQLINADHPDDPGYESYNIKLKLRLMYQRTRIAMLTLGVDDPKTVEYKKAMLAQYELAKEKLPARCKTFLREAELSIPNINRTLQMKKRRPESD